MYQKQEYSKNRKAILLALFKQPMDYSALRDETKLSDPTLSKHLKDLLNSNLIGFKREGKRKIYRINEKAFECAEVVSHLAGVSAALNLLKGKNFEEVLADVFSYGNEAVESFLTVISRILILTNKEKTKGKNIYNEIISTMQSDYNELKEMDGLEYQKRADKLNSIYFALGPPFSYQWKNMVERLEREKI
ncbi:hypothetical protein DRO97_07230 [Archaeoglobales archaeon]|nr:MAG: hypothetical protein DRO97_07230 [Archaeoglobales archaeon]